MIEDIGLKKEEFFTSPEVFSRTSSHALCVHVCVRGENKCTCLMCTNTEGDVKDTLLAL